MEQEILEAIQETNTLLSRLAVVMLVVAAVVVIRSVVVIISHGRHIRVKHFTSVAEDLFEQGDYKELLRKSDQQLTKLPNSAEGLFYKARAESELGSDDAAKKSIKRLLQLTPTWRSDWMEKHLADSKDQETDA